MMPKILDNHPKIKTLTSYTRAQLFKSNGVYFSLTGEDLEIYKGFISDTILIGNYTDHADENGNVDSSYWPGCSYYNYGVAVELVSNLAHLTDAQTAMVPNQWTQYQTINGYYCHADPLIGEINLSIASLKEPNSGLAWKWNETMKGIRAFQNTLQQFQEQLNPINEELPDVIKELNTIQQWLEGVALSYGIVNIYARVALVISLINLKHQQDELKDRKKMNQAKGEELAKTVEAYNEENQQFINEVEITDQERQACLNTFEEFKQEIAAFNQGPLIREYNSIVDYLNNNPSAPDAPEKLIKLNELKIAIEEKESDFARRERAIVNEMQRISDTIDEQNAHNERLTRWHDDIELQTQAWEQEKQQLDNEEARLKQYEQHLRQQIAALGTLTQEVEAQFYRYAQRKSILETRLDKLKQQKNNLDLEMRESTEKLTQAFSQGDEYFRGIRAHLTEFNRTHKDAYEIRPEEGYKIDDPTLEDLLDTEGKIPPEKLEEILDHKIEGIIHGSGGSGGIHWPGGIGGGVHGPGGIGGGIHGPGGIGGGIHGRRTSIHLPKSLEGFLGKTPKGTLKEIAKQSLFMQSLKTKKRTFNPVDTKSSIDNSDSGAVEKDEKMIGDPARREELPSKLTPSTQSSVSSSASSPSSFFSSGSGGQPQPGYSQSTSRSSFHRKRKDRDEDETENVSAKKEEPKASTSTVLQPW